VKQNCEGDGVSRAEAVERLRVWAQRAQHEAAQADTRASMLQWQAQSQALTAVANFVASQDPQTPDDVVYRLVVADRTRSLSEWAARQGGEAADFYAGAVAGYDLAITTIKGMDGRIWPRVDAHSG
jgi:hypothetical protein